MTIRDDDTWIQQLPLLQSRTTTTTTSQHPRHLDSNSDWVRDTPPVSFGDRMRKYYKLVLCLVTLASLVCFLFYKTQYDKLYKVLSVLEYFGNDPNIRGHPLCAPKSGFLHWQAPSFQQISVDSSAAKNESALTSASASVFVYSAFCQANPEGPGECGKIMALALVRGGAAALKGLKCEVWHKNSIRAAPGVFSFTKVSNIDASDDAYVPYHLNCENPNPPQVPYGINLFSSQKTKSYLHVEDITRESLALANSLGVCIRPQSGHADSTYPMLESVLLNSYFGVKDFLVYDGGLTHTFVKAMHDARADDALLNVRLVPWNPPAEVTTEAAEFLVRQDCFLRTRPEFETVALLKPEQILVPKSDSSVSGVLKRIDEKQMFGLLTMQVRHFCSEFPADASASAKNEYELTALEQTVYDRTLPVSHVELLHKMDATSGSGRNRKQESDSGSLSPEHELAVHDYGKCGKLDFAEGAAVSDLSVSRKSEQILKSIGRHFMHRTV